MGSALGDHTAGLGKHRGDHAVRGVGGMCRGDFAVLRELFSPMVAGWGQVLQGRLQGDASSVRARYQGGKWQGAGPGAEGKGGRDKCWGAACLFPCCYFLCPLHFCPLHLANIR